MSWSSAPSLCLSPVGQFVWEQSKLNLTHQLTDSLSVSMIFAMMRIKVVLKWPLFLIWTLFGRDIWQGYKWPVALDNSFFLSGNQKLTPVDGQPHILAIFLTSGWVAWRWRQATHNSYRAVSIWKWLPNRANGSQTEYETLYEERFCTSPFIRCLYTPLSMR